MRNFREEDGVRGYIQLARFASLELACVDDVLEPIANVGGWSTPQGMCRIQCEIIQGCVAFTIGVGLGNEGECSLRGEACANRERRKPVLRAVHG